MKRMTRRERVYAAINHKEFDRLPISFGGTLCSGITESPPNGPLSRLYEHLAKTEGMKDFEPIEIPDVFNIIAYPDRRVQDRLHSDMVTVTSNRPEETVRLEDDGVTKTLKYACGMRVRRVGPYDEPVDYPMKHMTTEKDIDEYPYWTDTSINVMEGVVERARYFHEETDLFVSGDSLATFYPFNAYCYLGGMEKFLTDMRIRPNFFHRLSQKMLDIGLATIDQFFGGIGKYLDGAVIYDDLGTQQGPMMSLTDYREFYKPYTAEIIKRIRRYIRPEAKIIYHSCGSTFSYLADFIEIGVNVINPLQPLAKNMEPWRLKREFGKDVAFLGGWDIQRLLPLGTPEENREGVKKLISEYAHDNTGYIFAPSHNIEPDTPPENIVAGYDEAYEYGRNPIPKPTGQSYVDFIRSMQIEARV